MKKTLLLAIIALMVPFALLAQSQRMVLAEEFTNASCGPCATYNPAFDALLQANSDIVTSIKYHTSWPGTDPMYSHNTQQNSARTSYYNVSAVPHALLDGGSSFSGSPGNMNQQTIDNAAAITSPFEMQFQHEISADQDSIYLTMIIEATDDVSGALRAHMVVIEEHIHFNSPPGYNGETDFYNVMKYMVPSASGTSLPSFESGDYMILEGSWELANVYDVDELAAVGFVQSNNTKVVHQAVNSSEDALTPLYSYDAQALEVKNVSESNCTGTTEPHLVIRNNGAETLNSLDILYSVNEEEVHTYTWTGSLDFLEKEVVMLPEISFMIQEDNELLIETRNPGGQQDEYVGNDQYSFTINQAIEAQHSVTLSMRLDDNPEETSWEVLNSEGDVMYEGDDYTSAGQFIQEVMEFDTEDCYTFYIYDEGGDGFETGGFASLNAGNETILQVTRFGSMAMNVFEIANPVSVTEIKPDDLQIYPNPASDFINLKISGEDIICSLMDLSGRLLKEQTIEHSTGIIQFDLSDIENGIYLLKLNTGGTEVSRKVTVTK